MNFVIAVVAGVLIGWLASMLMPAAGREDLIRNVAVGIAGSYVGGWLVSTLSESVDTGGLSFGAVIASCFGAIVLLLLVKRFRRA